MREEIAAVETFTELKALAPNPHFQAQKRQALCALSDETIDGPIVDLVNGFNALACCFTLQCCYGHFIQGGQKDIHNLEPLPDTGAIGEVTYRIAYIALCIENSPSGKVLLDALKQITAMDPKCIQFGCAEWFWEKQINSYALQVEPDRFKHQDTATIGLREALHIEKIRNEMFVRLHQWFQGPGAGILSEPPDIRTSGGI